MRHVSELHNKHKGEDIYIINSGASLDHIDTSFFQNKITVGVNQVYRKLDCTYLVRKEKSLIKESLMTGSKVICSRWDSGDIKKGKKLLNTVGLEDLDFYVFDHLENGHTNIDFSVLDRPGYMIVSYSTITSAMHVAAHLGAKNIIIVAHDCGTLNDKHTFDGYYKDISETPWKNWKEYIDWLKVIEDQTIQVKKRLSNKYGCNILSLNPFVNYNLEGNVFKGKNLINDGRK